MCRTCNFKAWNSLLSDSYEIFLKNKIIYGRFDDALMEFEVFVSEEDLSLVEKGISLLSMDLEQISFSSEERELADAAWCYIQAYNHELFHFYQVLSLPSFRMRHILKRNMLKFEAATMLKFFEQGGSYSVGEDDSIMNAVNNGKENIS